jgi:hypothetical protein
MITLTSESIEYGSSFAPIENRPESPCGRLVICGSMAAVPHMWSLEDEFRENDIGCVVPQPDGHLWENRSIEELQLLKRRASMAHLRKIRDRRTVAILVVNVERHGIANYIGANTFAEIALAFFLRRHIFLYQGICDDYAEELLAWGAIPLNGDIKRVISHVRRVTSIPTQLTLF